MWNLHSTYSFQFKLIQGENLNSFAEINGLVLESKSVHIKHSLTFENKQSCVLVNSTEIFHAWNFF